MSLEGLFSFLDDQMGKDRSAKMVFDPVVLSMGASNEFTVRIEGFP
jgi:hypothetical protein